MKVIRISDELHTKLKEHADIDRRTINAEAEIIFTLYFSDAEGGLTSEEVARYRAEEARQVQEFIVNEGKELGLLKENTPTPKNTTYSKPWNDAKEELLQDPETKKEYEALIHSEKKIAEATPRTDDLFKPDPLRLGEEQVCCANELQPCKHWVWDTASGEGYKNVLSGRFMDVE